MYNAEQKASFLKDLYGSESSPATINNAENVFARLEPFEEAAGADICTMDLGQLQNIMEQIAQLAHATRQNFLRIMRKYGEWCIENDVPGATDGLLQLNLRDVGLKKLRESTVSGPKHLQRCLNDVFSPEYEETIDNVYRTYFWLAFTGVPVNDALALRTSDFDPKTMSVRVRDQVFRFPPEAFDAVRNTAELKSFRYIHKNYVGARRARFDSDQFMRGIKAESTKVVIYSAACQTMRKAFEAHKTDTHLTYRSARMSGLFYRLFEVERSDFKRYANGVTDRLVSSVMNEFLMNDAEDTRAINELCEDYRRWKLAFCIKDP